MAYDWPGNVRELQNIAQLASVKSKGATIQPAHLPPGFGLPPSSRVSRRRKLDPQALQDALRKTGGNKLQAAMDPVTENLAVGATEVWEIYNTTGDAHPMHVHEVVFEVVSRQDIFVDEETQQVQVVPGSLAIPAESWETGFKDTVTAYPGQVTRIRAQFNTPGQFVRHCHIAL
jgi:FtsP/CotA-like multicopper oxidase with cupredoxin domain